MREYIRATRRTMRLRAALSMVALAALTACGGESRTDTAAANSDSASAASANADSAAGRDLAMAPRDSVQPQLQDVPAPPPPPAPVEAAPTPPPAPKPRAPRPSPRPAPAPAPAAPAAVPAPAAPAGPVTGEIAAGTSLRFAASSTVCSNTAAVGDKFTATLDAPVTATHGLVVPEGAAGTFEVTEAKTAKNSNEATSLSVKLLSVTYGGRTYPIDAVVQSAATERVRSTSKAADAKKVAGGAILGAIAGQMIGKNTKGTVIGAAAGAAAGTAAAAATANFDTCLNTGARISVTLTNGVTVKGDEGR